MPWVRDTFAALEPYTAPQTYVNYLADDDATGRRHLRAQPRPAAGDQAPYDPDNLFRLNHNIPPA